MTRTVYIKLNQISQVHEKNVFLKDIGIVACSDQPTASRCRAVKIRTIHSDKKMRYVGSVVDVIEAITKEVPGAEVASVGESDYIIDYEPASAPAYLWQWCKTLFVCLICFSGAAFAIMSFNNDSSVLEVFSEIYRLVMGRESDGLTALELGYCIGLAAGILIFFNHFAKWKLSVDPTPLEVEMRLYEENLNKTLIENDGRRESGVDVS